MQKTQSDTVEKPVRLKWQKVVFPAVNEILDAFESQEIDPTLRTGFYSLVAKGILENTKDHYKRLSKYTAKWRENSLSDNTKGKLTLPMDCFVDESRQIIEIEDDYYTSEEYIEKRISYLRNAPKRYRQTVPMWNDQPNYVEVWVEKDAMAGTLESILKDRQVRIVPLKGFSGLDYMYRNTQRLIEKQQRMKKTIHILYFGDYDPSGIEIEYNIKNKFKIYGLEGYHFERISLTKEQIEEYQLPRSYNKIIDKKNTHTKKFKEQNNGEVFQIELDAMQAFRPEEFKNLTQQSVDSLFDEDIYEQMLEAIPDEAEIIGLVTKKMEELSRELEEGEE